MAHIASCVAGREPASTPPSDKHFAWRMLQPDQQRRYQLFPRDKPEQQAFAEKPLRLRTNNQPVRRRKVSVQESSPMTTVQEVSMDSPTIPGRPPIHERSASAPEDAVRAAAADATHNHYRSDDFAQAIDDALTSIAAPAAPKQLAPLVIPTSSRPRLQPKTSPAPPRSDSAPPRPSPRSAARIDASPLSRMHLTPSSASTPDLTNPYMYPRSATTDGASTATLPTPVSAPLVDCGCGEDMRGPAACRHHRGASESSSVMDRGRPRMRGDDDDADAAPRPVEPSGPAARDKSSERRAFEELPRGWKPSDAVARMSASDVATLHKQAYGQAARFEVLRAEDVEALSRELRQLDGRTEYLRRTYSSLRAGRRNLHSRICQYLRSPRVARFSHVSMLRQEEALAELDASIDDWVTKLEQAENRRTRVRQKLLEHVAAATMLAVPGAAAVGAASESLQQALGVRPSPSPPSSSSSPQQQQAPRELSTPPRSPSRPIAPGRAGSVSPPPPRVVAQVPSTILEQPVVEAAATARRDGDRTSTATRSPRRADVESIRIYAGDDVFALLADVENEISMMGTSPADDSPKKQPEPVRERPRNHDKQDAVRPLTPISPPAPTPPLKDNKSEAEFLLTSAVFRP